MDQSYGPIIVSDYELTIDGNFSEVLKYLDILRQEKSPIYWSTLDYRVIDRPVAFGPVARVKLTMQVVSKE